MPITIASCLGRKVLPRLTTPGWGNIAGTARCVVAVNPGNRPALPFQRLMRPSRSNPTVRERTTGQRPISVANRHEGWPARPMTKTYPRYLWRKRLAGFVADSKSVNGSSPPLAS